MMSQWRAKNMQNLDQFYTTSDWDREYLRNETRYQKSKRYVISNDSSRVQPDKSSELWSTIRRRRADVVFTETGKLITSQIRLPIRRHRNSIISYFDQLSLIESRITSLYTTIITSLSSGLVLSDSNGTTCCKQTSYLYPFTALSVLISSQ